MLRKSSVLICLLFTSVWPQTPPGCSEQSPTDPKLCKTCLPGYHLLKEKKCQLCPQSCLTCTQADKCQTCNYGKYLNTTSNNCLNCPKNCFKCKTTGTNSVECESCAQSYILLPDTKKCSSCPRYCEKCKFIKDKENKEKLTCSECDSNHRLNRAGKCVDVYIEAFGISFMYGLIIFILTIFGILLLCPKIFESVSKAARKNKLQNMKIYKKLRKKKKGEDEYYDPYEDDDSSD